MTMFSLRDNLIAKQGVNNTDAIKHHLSQAYELIKANPSLRAHKYRVNPNNPNALAPSNMG